MTLNDFNMFCQALPGCSVRYPFASHPDLHAWCIGTKMFAWAITSEQPLMIQLKADPDLVPDLIANYEAIHPGYHMNKRHWVTVKASCDPAMLRHLLEDAHGLVVAQLSKPERLRLLAD